MSMTANEFLMGGGIPSAHSVFVDAPFGTSVTGTIATLPEVVQQTDLDTGELKFWNDGKPMMQMAVTLQTDLRNPEMVEDTGLRKLFVKAKLLEAVRTAVRASAAKGLDVGGVLTVTYIADGERKKAGKNPPKIYTATYAPPSAAQANAFLNGQQPQAAPPQQAPAATFVPPNQGPAPQWAAPAQQPAPATPPAPADGRVWTPPPGMDPQQAAALANLQPAQRAQLGY